MPKFSRKRNSSKGGSLGGGSIGNGPSLNSGSLKNSTLKIKNSKAISGAHVSNLGGGDSKSSMSIKNVEESNISVKVIAISIVIAFILQVFLAPLISIYDASPNFLLIDMIFIAALSTQIRSIVLGFVLGLLCDLLGGGPVGIMAMTFSITAYLIGLLATSAPTQGFAVWSMFIVGASILVCFVYGILMAIFGYEQNFFASILLVILPTIAYTVAFGLLGFFVYRRFAQ